MDTLVGKDGAVVSDAVRESFSVTVIDRAELSSSPVWSSTFADERKDYRYYEIIEDTLREGFDYKYFAIRDASGRIRAIQPFFLLDQDVLEGVGSEWRLISTIRRRYPRFLKMRTLMVGCSAGEGHLADGEG
ncbi:MAG: GNAT family N-acetyltransferase, partial [Candidatus Afipia apatlaquensis]|nr:GNAT family N-acetyltransferase [Candidatus Afipia apatlaquensis]